MDTKKVVYASSWVEEDRLSSLPDNIIINQILALCPTKYSIRTSVLSKRWKHLWAFSPKLDLELDLKNIYMDDQERYERYLRVCVNTFAKSINKIFSLRNNMNVETFKLDIDSHVLDLRPYTSLWLGAIVICGVREIDLKIGYGDDDGDLGELPRCLFTCKTIAVLKLSGRFILNVPNDVRLSNLKTLLLASVIYTDDATLPKLLSGCPILEDLHIIRLEWDDMLILNVAISSLKRLELFSITEEINYCFDTDQCSIVVDSPNLEFIDITVGWLDDTLLKPLPNVIEAYISMQNPIKLLENVSKNKVIALLESIVNVRRLYLSGDTLEYLLFVDNEVDLPTFSNLVRLEIWYDEYPLELMNLLRSSPNLETLCLPTMGDFSAADIDDDINFEFHNNNPTQVPECLCHSLKTVEIQCMKGEEIEVNIVKYLLKNAKVLEKMVICWNSYYREKFVELETELRNYPKLSTNCQLDLLL